MNMTAAETAPPLSNCHTCANNIEGGRCRVLMMGLVFGELTDHVMAWGNEKAGWHYGVVDGESVIVTDGKRPSEDADGCPGWQTERFEYADNDMGKILSICEDGLLK